MIEKTSTLKASPTGRLLRQAPGSMGSVASITRASLRSLAFKTASARSRRDGVRVLAIAHRSRNLGSSYDEANLGDVTRNRGEPRSQPVLCSGRCSSRAACEGNRSPHVGHSSPPFGTPIPGAACSPSASSGSNGMGGLSITFLLDKHCQKTPRFRKRHTRSEPADLRAYPAEMRNFSRKWLGICCEGRERRLTCVPATGREA